jgi:guanylate kinase
MISEEHRTVIYIEAGDWFTLKARALARAPMSDEELEKRYLRYQEEVQVKPFADIVIENTEGQLTAAREQVATIVTDIINQVQHQM